MLKFEAIVPTYSIYYAYKVLKVKENLCCIASLMQFIFMLKNGFAIEIITNCF